MVIYGDHALKPTETANAVLARGSRPGSHGRRRKTLLVQGAPTPSPGPSGKPAAL